MSRLAAGDFAPPAGLRNPHVQSALRSLWPSRTLASRRARALLESQQAWIMEAGNGVRLQGFYNRAQASSRGLAVLLHGWEGSSQSSYMLSTGARLLAEGYDVFRLNFRDHGDSHALNRGVFHSCRLDEVLGALGDMQGRTGCDEWQIAGFSLGGNFALRVALRGPEAGLGVRNCVAICPVLDPEHVLKCMETGPTFYERYYNRKWADSLSRKQVCFPGEYDYETFRAMDSMRERTRFLATRYYGYRRLEDYFQGYSVAGNTLAGLEVRATILTAADDPVVPVADIDSLPALDCLETVITEHGGHCGYIKNWKLESWAEDFILDRFNAAPRQNTAGIQA